jgi:hypothetical protein
VTELQRERKGLSENSCLRLHHSGLLVGVGGRGCVRVCVCVCVRVCVCRVGRARVLEIARGMKLKLN